MGPHNLKASLTTSFRHNSKIRSRQHWSNRLGPRSAFAALLLVWACVLPVRGIDAQRGPTEYQVKAAYMLNFLKFVEWPGDPNADIHERWIIGIVGENPFRDELTQIITGKTVQGHELEVRQFQPGEDFRGCRVLFISASEKKRLPTMLAALNGSSVLTVGDMDHFIESGGMIQFVMEEKRVRFAIDISASSRARLKLSSKLLSLARTVTGTERAGND
jgi:hypothetical protein